VTVDPRQWKYRRRAVFLILIACLSIIGLSVWQGGDDAVRVAAINALSMIIAFVAAFYIFTPSLEAGWQVLAGLVERKGKRDD
jgi:amino acid permease